MKDGKINGEVSSYFVLGADEICHSASNGKCHIISDKLKKKMRSNRKFACFDHYAPHRLRRGGDRPNPFYRLPRMAPK
jgi:hypothetical protein